jgi:micrococcal nuclease
MRPALTIVLLLTALLRAEDVKCLRCIDGDTIEVQLADGKTDRVRLAAVDAPELKSPGGAEAKAFLVKLIAGKTVRLDGTRRDKYRRRVSQVYVGKKWVQLSLVRSGHAVRMDKYSHDPRLGGNAKLHFAPAD